MKRKKTGTRRKVRKLPRLAIRPALLFLLCALLFCLLAGCAPTPDNGQIEAAIRASLAEEDAPPALDFGTMEVPMRCPGKASAVLWTADRSIQRSYTLKYSSKSRAFTVDSVRTGHLTDEGGVLDELSFVN